MIDAGNTAWLITATALVLFMTLPGLALFYGGLVRAENLLSVLMQCFSIAALVSVLWLIAGYSLTFSGDGDFLGNLDKAMLFGVARDAADANGLPESVFFMFQMTFAIITPALIVGAFAERMRFGAVMLFSALWLFLVYVPVAHWIWGGGWLADRGILDFAGGLVVHLTAGISALVLAILIGPRTGFPDEVTPPHAPWMTMAGACMLWVGWFGFNAGSALSAGAGAGMAMTVTHLSAATATLVWIVIEWAKFGKPSMIGAVTGAIAGLATITPASGYVGPGAALVLGCAGGVICYLMVGVIKRRFRIDDSLDVFAVHGVGGAVGILLAAVFASATLGGVGYAEGQTMGGQFLVQLLGIAATLLWSLVASVIIAKVVQAACGLRVDAETEEQGLDLRIHGERGYNM